MGCMIAVSGKGGVGKTTVSALLVKQLLQNGRKPLLAIDADPNSCLDAALGLKVESTVGSAREEVRDEVQKGMTGISKNEMLRMKIEESLVESKGFDLIAMGRPEGPGCYCYANNVLKSVIGEMAGRYECVVLDNEAGLENLSRRIVQKVDMLVMVTDPSSAGVKTLKRLYDLAKEMDISYGRLVIVVNRTKSDLPQAIEKIKEEIKADAVIALPDDEEVTAIAEAGESLLNLSSDNPLAKAVDDMVKNFI